MKLLGLSKDVVQQSWEDATRSRDHHHHRRRQAEQQPAPLQRSVQHLPVSVPKRNQTM